MEIRVLRGAEVRQLSADGGMRRPHAPNHDRRVGAARGPAAALNHGHAGRSGHVGQHAGLSRRSGMFRSQAREPDPAQQTAAILVASGSGAAVRGRARLSGRPVGRRRNHRDPHRRRQRTGDATVGACGSRRSGSARRRRASSEPSRGHAGGAPAAARSGLGPRSRQGDGLRPGRGRKTPDHHRDIGHGASRRSTAPTSSAP